MEIEENGSATKLGYLNKNNITNIYKTIFHMVVHLTNIGYFFLDPLLWLSLLIPYLGIMVSYPEDKNLHLKMYVIHHQLWVTQSNKTATMNPTYIHYHYKFNFKKVSRRKYPKLTPSIYHNKIPKMIKEPWDHLSILMGESRGPPSYNKTWWGYPILGRLSNDKIRNFRGWYVHKHDTYRCVNI